MPVQCILHRDLSEATLNPPGGRFEVLETYLDRSHHTRQLLGCRECGQRYFHEFYEETDWENGDDSMYSTYIPVRNGDDIARLRALTTPMELLTVVPSLQDDRPTGGSRTGPRWVGLPGGAG